MLPLKHPNCKYCNRIMREQETGRFRCDNCLHWENPVEGTCWCPNCDKERQAKKEKPYDVRPH
jgi:Zn finger protein HypA/HybF involved in hydrogenase expression